MIAPHAAQGDIAFMLAVATAQECDQACAREYLVEILRKSYEDT